MKSLGSISAKHQRERAHVVNAVWIGWQATVYVLLDDVLTRGSRS